MANKLLLARVVQIGFWITGLTFLSVVYLGLGGVVGMGIALVTVVPFVIAVMTLRCRKCDVSYFFDPSINSWNISGVNLLKPVKSRCPKCGAERAEV